MEVATKIFVIEQTLLLCLKRKGVPPELARIILSYHLSSKAILLFSSLATDQIQVVNTRRLETALEAKKVTFEKVNGSLVENKTLREVLFAASGIRGKYPQCFIASGDMFQFVGQWEEMESLLDCDQLPKEILANNPHIATFSKVF